MCTQPSKSQAHEKKHVTILGIWCTQSSKLAHETKDVYTTIKIAGSSEETYNNIGMSTQSFKERS
jgi:hypothetical protein